MVGSQGVHLLSTPSLGFGRRLWPQISTPSSPSSEVRGSGLLPRGTITLPVSFFSSFSDYISQLLFVALHFFRFYVSDPFLFFLLSLLQESGTQNYVLFSPLFPRQSSRVLPPSGTFFNFLSSPLTLLLDKR